MGVNSGILERMQIVEGFPCVDLQTGANTGDWVNLKGYGRCAIVFVSGIGTAGDDPTVTMLQATTAAGAGSKALNTTTYWKKQAATNLAAVAQFTKVTQSSGNTMTNTDGAEQSLIWVADFKASDLDINNGFTFLSATIADIGTNAQPGYLFYILYDPAWPQDAAHMLTAIS